MTRTLCTLTVTAAVLAAGAGISLPTAASVVLNGTRVIYSAGQASKTLQLENDDDHPNLVQVWVDADAQDNAEIPAPFIVNPPIFRMAAHTGQMVRLRFVGPDAGSPALPADRESVFYLNFTQIPALPQDQRDTSQLVFLLQSQVKIFYRPKGLPEQDLSCASLRFTREGKSVQVENISAYHVVVSRADWVDNATANDAPAPLAQAQMLAPFAQANWRLPQASAQANPADQTNQTGQTGGDAAVRLWLRNDYGADAGHTCPVMTLALPAAPVFSS